VPDLDERLRATRTHLLDEISQPDLAVVRRRATTLRHRRRAMRGGAGAALLVLAVAGVVLGRPWTGGGTGGTGNEPAATPGPSPSSVTVFLDRGLTVNGLVRDQAITELPGEVRDIEFVDPDRGWALASECPKGAGTCRLTIAGTDDGGLTWTARQVSTRPTGPDSPDLVVLAPDTLVLHWPAGPSRLSADGGVTWQAVYPPGGRAPASLGVHDRLLLRPGGSGCAGSAVEVWRAGRGNAGDIATAPPLDVCWVGTVRGADGGWWVGGTLPGGRAAAAVSYNGGATWQRHDLDGETGSARVATLGSAVFAAVVDSEGALRGIYYSAGRGDAFTRTWRGGDPRTLGGEPVPLLDDRLMISDGADRWFVSGDRGRTFQQATALPPNVGRIERTAAGFVAYNVVADGWTAFSSDGATWRKLHVH
jgi:hypothetical protein